MFGFAGPNFSGVESTLGVGGRIAGVLNAQVIITNGVAVAAGSTVVVNCIPSATGSATGSAIAFCELYECCDGVVAVVIRVADNISVVANNNNSLDNSPLYSRFEEKLHLAQYLARNLHIYAEHESFAK